MTGVRQCLAVAVAAGAVLTVQPAAAAAQADCPPYDKPIRISFKTLNPDPTYNNTLNVMSLRDFLRTRGHVFSGQHQKTLGVTSYRTAFSLAGRTVAMPAAHGFCVYLSEVTAEFGYRDHDVFVASEFRPGSCEYKAILDHENQHVAINRAAIRDGGPRVRQELERLLQTAPPRFTRAPQSGTEGALSDIYARLNKTVDAIAAGQGAKNAAIDNDGNYDAIGDLCGDWDKGNVWPSAPPATRSRR